MTDVIPIQGMPSAPHLDFAGEVRRATGMPTFHAAKIQDVATARHAIASGLLDMVGMTRAHMADPHIVRKIEEGREHDIRPCVGANYCLDRIYQGGEALCIHNPATGRELSLPHIIKPAADRRKIVIVGAGPAGLEAARVASARGHEVVVLEAANRAGGQLLLTARTKRRAEMMQIVDWRVAQCEAGGVDLRYNLYAEAADVLAESPDVVIIATGGMANTTLYEGDTPDHVVSAWDILSGDVKPAGSLLIYDEAGDHSGLQAAEMAVDAGCTVEIMTPDRTFAPEVMAMNLVPYMRNLQRDEVTFTVTKRLRGVLKDGNRLRAIIGTDYSDKLAQADYDQIVVNYGTMPLDALYHDLRPSSSNGGAIDQAAFLAIQPQTTVRNTQGTFQLFRIGDAVSARNTHAAIYDALRLMTAV
jgi:NADPH-dependent 2,4-dienoyl-CoA reductase/sulfur reductase-like enzyme